MTPGRIYHNTDTNGLLLVIATMCCEDERQVRVWGLYHRKRQTLFVAWRVCCADWSEVGS